MSKNIRTQMNKVVGKSLNAYYQRVKPAIDDIKFKEQYQGRIIDCMVGEVDDNYIETPETDAPIVKLEHSKEGVVKIPSIKGKTILVDAEGNETDTPGEGCRLVSVGEDEDNKLIILSNNRNLWNDNVLETESVKDLYEVVMLDGRRCVKNKKKIWRNAELNLHYFKPNTQYRISMYAKNTDVTSEGTSLYLKVYYIDGTEQSCYTNNNSGSWYKATMVTLNKTISHISLCNTANSIGYIDLDSISITEGATEVEYIKPKQHKTEILLDEPLRSLEDVTDEIVGNRIIKRIEENICIGDENEVWQTKENFSNEEFLTFVFFTNKKITNSKFPKYICNIFPNIPEVWSKNEIGVTYQQAKVNGEELIWLKLKRSEFPNIGTLKEWLKNNNLIVYNEKMYETIEELPNSITLQGFDDTTMYIENSITPTVQYGYNALIPYKEELRTQKEEVETNTLDIENNIVPYLMDMEYNLMLMEDN